MAHARDRARPQGASRSGSASDRRVTPDRSLWQEIARARLAYLLLLPMFLSMIVFVYYPPLSALYHAFFRWDPTQPTAPFVGQAALNMLQLLTFSVVVGTVVPLVVAELIFAVRNVTARYAYRFLFLIPVIVPAVVTILLWRFFYDPNLGVFNALLDAIGLGGLKQDWLGSFNTALYAIMFVGFPFAAGTSVLIYLAGLINISGEVLEAAALDGATGLQRIIRIDLPLLVGQIRLFVVLGIIGGVQAFQLQLIITNPPGGPGWQTTVPALEMYLRAVQESKYGVASAIGLLLFLFVLLLTILNFRLFRTTATDGA